MTEMWNRAVTQCNIDGGKIPTLSLSIYTSNDIYAELFGNGSDRMLLFE